MIYQETYQAGGNPSKMNISSVIYTRDLSRSTPHTPLETNHGFPAHCHSFYEVSYTIEGSTIYESDNRQFDLPEGSFTFLPPLSMHSIRDDRRSCHLLLQFSTRLIHSQLSSIRHFELLAPAGKLAENGHLSILPGTRLHQCITDLIALSPKLDLLTADVDRIIDSYSYRDELCYSATVLTFLSLLLEEGALAVSNNSLNMTDLSKMQMLLSRLVSAPEEKLSMEEAAALVNMSYSNFCRTFHSALGCSYVEFCNSIRILRAQELLLHSTMSVTEIAVHLNFGSISYFNRIFKKHTGCTPLSYRTSH